MNGGEWIHQFTETMVPNYQIARPRGREGAQFVTKAHNMVFIGIYFLFPNRAYTNFKSKIHRQTLELTSIYHKFEV